MAVGFVIVVRTDSKHYDWGEGERLVGSREGVIIDVDNSGSLG